MPKPSNKAEFVAAGMRVMFRQGYHGTAIRDVVAEGRVPQGSFTNHFGSKEAFAEEVLNQFFEQTKAIVAQALGDRSLSPRQRLLRYLDLITASLAADDYLRGCLIGDFSIEISQTSEHLRERLVAIYREWLRPFEDCIAEGQKAGEIDDRFTPQDLADFLLTSWEGAILRMKVAQLQEPLERFKKIAFATIFAKGT
ncbi:TetR family transcriptional regulator C-terminal domain-containing protein [Labrys neptuniae]